MGKKSKMAKARSLMTKRLSRFVFTKSALFSAVIVLSISSVVFAKENHSEKWYQLKWCKEHRGEAEVMLSDKTRCDCITESHAVEVDFAHKWAEAIGQSLYYSLQTGKTAGIVLILRTQRDYKYWIRLNSTIQYFELPIQTWFIKSTK